MSRIYYTQKYDKFGETRFHEVEHESKMRLIKIQSNASERRGYEAEKERQLKGKYSRPIRKR